MAENSIAQQLEVQLQSLGVADCSILPLHDTESVVFSKVFCIVLCELEKPVLFDLQGKEYYNL